MACQIVIQQVLGQILNGTWLASITVAGTASDCAEVTLSIQCKGRLISHQVPVVAGAWNAVFTGDDLKISECLECGSDGYPITVQANCADPNKPCIGDTKTLPEIPCASVCPTISQIEEQVPPCSSAAGGWNVSFSAHINGSGVTTCLWDFGDGTNPTVGALPQGGVATIQHLYPCAGQYAVSLTILSNCQPNYSFSDTVLLELPTCGCSHISEISSNAVAGNPCTWNFIAKVGEPYPTTGDPSGCY